MTPPPLQASTGKFCDVVLKLRPHVETAIDALIRIPDLTVGDDLQSMLDQGLYNPRLSTLFETLWTARFRLGEGRAFDAPLGKLRAGTFEEPVALLCSDALLFWLTLLSHNFPSTRGKLVLVLQGPLDPDLRVFERAVAQWRPLGSPLEISISPSVEF